MRSLFPFATFTGFGPTPLFPSEFVSQSDRVRGKKPDRLRKGVRSKRSDYPASMECWTIAGN